MEGQNFFEFLKIFLIQIFWDEVSNLLSKTLLAIDSFLSCTVFNHIFIFFVALLVFLFILKNLTDVKLFYWFIDIRILCFILSNCLIMRLFNQLFIRRIIGSFNNINGINFHANYLKYLLIFSNKHESYLKFFYEFNLRPIH